MIVPGNINKFAKKDPEEILMITLLKNMVKDL